MVEHINGSTTLPRDFKFKYQEYRTTPEPNPAIELRQPSPPRQRLRVRRRVASNLQAPTEQFLASVAAADFPLPTIELPEFPETVSQQDQDETKLLLPRRRLSPPKTPAPLLEIETKELRKPNWDMDSVHADYSHRPFSSHSVDSDISHDSSRSNSNFGRLSEDDSCTSPESDYSDPFLSSIMEKTPRVNRVDKEKKEPIIAKLNANIRSKARNDAPWSRVQIAHLWATYLLYLQDPTVTPLRIGASRVPPEGVCHRVAREARRSWKGPKIFQSQTSLGSSTPTDSYPRSYAKWPHSSSATRSNLRNLCRQRDPSSVSRFHHYLQSRSPTPFSKPTPFRPQKISPSSRREGIMNTNDISISLSLCTASSMQPDGPLASLAQDEPGDSSQPITDASTSIVNSETRSGSNGRVRRLGSPFSRSYGPSTSKMFNRPLSISGSLGSPFDFDKLRILNGTQKRPALFSLHEELSTSSTMARPNLINELRSVDFSDRSRRRVRTRGFSLGDESLAAQALHSALELTPPTLTSNLTWSQGLHPGIHNPPRLRSPFAEDVTTNTYPHPNPYTNRAASMNSAFVNTHQTRRSIVSFDFGERRMSPQLETSRCEAKKER